MRGSTIGAELPPGCVGEADQEHITATLVEREVGLLAARSQAPLAVELVAENELAKSRDTSLAAIDRPRQHVITYAMRTASRSVFSILAIALISSCMGSSDEAWVTKYAAERFPCAERDIVVTTNEVNYFQAEGCGKTDQMMKFCNATSCKLNTISDLSTRGSFDFGCAEDQLQIVKLDRDTMGVSGCGQRATYKATLQGWVMNSSTTLDEGREPPPANDPLTEEASAGE